MKCTFLNITSCIRPFLSFTSHNISLPKFHRSSISHNFCCPKCLLIILPPLSYVFFCISHILSEDIQSVRSWSGNHLLPTGRFLSIMQLTALMAPAFLPFLFPCFCFRFPECVTALLYLNKVYHTHSTFYNLLPGMD